MTTLTTNSDLSENVVLDGCPVGVVYQVGDVHLAQPVGRTGHYRFATRSDAVAACVSSRVLGAWKNEL